jgi:hypothetical protein
MSKLYPKVEAAISGNMSRTCILSDDMERDSLLEIAAAQQEADAVSCEDEKYISDGPIAEVDLAGLTAYQAYQKACDNCAAAIRKGAGT